MARKLGLIVLIATAAGVTLASPAQGATVIGQTATADECSGGGYGGQVQLTSAGPSYTVPFDGTITSWSAASDAPGVETKLLVLQPVSGTTFHVAAKSDFGTFASPGVQTFAAQIPVKAGQVIGAWGQLCLIPTGNPGNQLASFEGAEPATGTDQDFGGIVGPENAADLSATVEPAVTGRRAAALRKCKKKHSKKSRRKCRKKAKKLPV
jgi:hypothetical protein